MNELVIPTKDKLLDAQGRPLTQGLFLEIGYTEHSVYTLKEDDHEYEGKLYPSLKKLYIELADPTEYRFATTYLLGWKHWLRLCENKILRKHIDDWRAELEAKLRYEAFQEMLTSSRAGKILATKWLADRGWAQRGAGRPTNAEIESERKLQARIEDEYSADIVRLNIN